jgi:general secretion pathway protein M
MLPSGLRGRVLALSLAALALGVIYLMAVAPLLEFYADNQVAADTKRGLVARLDAVSRELPALRSRVAELRAAAANDKQTIAGSSDAIASAGLQGRIGELAAAAGVTVGSVESLPAEVQDGYRRIGLRLVVTGSYEGLLQLLSRLERAVPPLFVDNLQIRSLQRRTGPGNATAVSGLNASFEVSGFRLDGPPEIAKK